jgi:hypothetical protein
MGKVQVVSPAESYAAAAEQRKQLSLAAGQECRDQVAAWKKPQPKKPAKRGVWKLF